MLLMIDNYDSFTYNLVQYLGELGEDVRVYRNDQITVEEIGSLEPERIVISPGPCTPNEAGVTVDTVKAYGGKIPMLGVCLGHQGIGQAYGGKIVQAKQLMHGKTSMIHHDGEGVFADLPTIIRLWLNEKACRIAWKSRPGPMMMKSWGLGISTWRSRAYNFIRSLF